MHTSKHTQLTKEECVEFPKTDTIDLQSFITFSFIFGQCTGCSPFCWHYACWHYVYMCMCVCVLSVYNIYIWCQQTHMYTYIICIYILNTYVFWVFNSFNILSVFLNFFFYSVILLIFYHISPTQSWKYKTKKVFNISHGFLFIFHTYSIYEIFSNFS